MRDGVAIVERSAPRVGGIVRFTTHDFPGRLAAVLFMQGCPWRCAYCHNPHLVPHPRDGASTEHRWPDVLSWLGTRRGLLDGVVFSGGEPTAQAALADAIRGVRTLGFAIGLHTAGIYPRRLGALLPSLDWVGLDVKAPAERYAAVTGVPASAAPAFDSLDRLLASGVALEVRTTVHPTLTPTSALVQLARELAARGVARWVLQRFRPTGCDDEATVASAPCGATVDSTLIAALRTHVPNVEVR